MTTDMTQGSTTKLLISYAIPTILGNLFQLTYNAVDSIIVGRYAGKEALAAVGTSNPIMNIILFFIIGICMGASVLMSEYYGAGDHKNLKREISTAAIIGLTFTVIISILVLIFSKGLLRLLRTPEGIIGNASTYLRIIFGGLFFTFLYNIYASALRSVGDSKTPIRFLAIAAVLNGCLDYIFIAHFHMGVAGAALATVIAEAVSGILCVIHVYKNIPLLRLEKKDFILDKGLLRRTLHYSWASALQQACLYIGKTLVQITVNPLGVDSIATFNAVNRVDDFAFTPQQSIAHGMTVYIAQNRGAKKYDRVKEGLKKGLWLEVFYGLFICLVIFFTATPIMSVFVKKEELTVITLGSAYLKSMAFFYLLPAFTNGIQGYFRGLGKMKITLNSTFTQMLVRVLFSFILAPKFGVQGIAFACLAGWIAMLLYEVPVLIKALKNNEQTLQP